MATDVTNDTIVRSLADVLLAPVSIALVGASDDAAKTTGRPLRFLRESGYEARIYPVNPTRATVQGERSWPSVSGLPEVPEHVFIMTGADAAVAAVEECGRLGVRVATILASGFGESGPEGQARERRLQRAAKETGIRLIGPSSLGIANPNNGLTLTANAAFAEQDLPGGTTFVASQSGSMIGALVSRGKARSIGFAGLVSTGGESDLGVGELCAATLDDPRVEKYLLFLENLKGAEKLRDFARGAAERGKPVTVYKLGRSDAAAELSVSHTGALAGADDVAQAFFTDNAMSRVETLEGLLETSALARILPVREPGAPPPRVGVVTTTGGGAAMIVDQLGIRGIDVHRASDETFAALAARGVDAEPSRIVDVTLAGTRYEVMSGALDLLLGSKEFDLLVAVIGSSARFDPDLALKALVDHSAHATPLAAFVVPDAPAALSMLDRSGVPAFRTPEACADAIAACLARRSPNTESGRRRLPSPAPESGSRVLDELEAYGFLDDLGIAHASVEVLDLPENLDDLDTSVVGLKYPVAVKVLDSRIAHKSDIGGVMLHVKDQAELAEAVRTIVRSVGSARPEVEVRRVLVQSMADGLGEVLVGYRVDPDAGPIVVLAAGGELAEIHRDRSIRTAPVTAASAREMIDEVAALELYRGFRGRPHGDLDALADMIVRVSEIPLKQSVTVWEAEVNPALIQPQGEGILAVDGLVRITDGATP